jgi:DNA-binding winged helix-turn-helix (wHTH) protein/TolB-like protein/Flp pilus assembly protein TadD
MSLENFPGFLLNVSQWQMNGEEKHSYWFKSFRLNVEERQLLDNGSPVPLTPKAFDVLATLVERSGQLVEKDELLKLVWADTVVEEANVARIVHTLRKVLGEDENGNKFIETVAKKGYRFVASVSEAREAPGPKSTNGKQNASVSVETSADDELQIPSARADASVTQPAAKQKREMKIFLLAVGFLTAVLLIVLLSINFRAKSSFTPNRVKSIAVLPFKPLSADSRNESLELGMAEAVINKLSGIRELIVRPVSSVRKYTSLEQDSIAAGRELGVDYVIEGSLQKEGEKTRATVLLLSVNDGKAVWSSKFDEQLATIFELQDSIAKRITEGLALELSGEERKRLAKHYTESTEAYQAYLTGRSLHHKRTNKGTEKGIEYFEQAIKLDLNYALAYAALADAHVSLVRSGARSTEENMPQAKAAVSKALEIDDTLAEAHAALGSIKFLEWDWLGAEGEFKRAIELNPNYERNHSDYDHCLRFMGRFDEAVAESKRALELEPASAFHHRGVAMALYFARRYDEAIAQCEKAIELDSTIPTTYRWLAKSYEQKRLYDQAVEAYLKTGAFTEHGAEAGGALRKAYATSGWRAFWQKLLVLKKERAKQRLVNTGESAEIYVRLGEKDQAFASLEKAYEQRQPLITFLNRDPVWDGLRSDPRYADLIRRAGLVP